MKWSTVALTLALVLVLGLPGLATAQEYRIGAIFSITGPGSSLGIPERDTALMLEAEVNAKGGLPGPVRHPVKIIIYDDASDETKAVLAAKKLIEEDRVSAIVGTSLSGTSLAILGAVQTAQVPLVSAAAAIKIVEPAAERRWVFKTPQSDYLIIDVLVDYLRSKGLTKVGWLHVDYAFGDLGWIEFQKAAPKAGLQIVASEKFGQRDVDMTPQLTRVKAANPQAVVVWSIPPSASMVTKNYRDLATLPEPRDRQQDLHQSRRACVQRRRLPRGETPGGGAASGQRPPEAGSPGLRQGL
jgi:branched-chain amino acid transport system substrate-binding protein